MHVAMVRMGIDSVQCGYASFFAAKNEKVPLRGGFG